MSKIIIGLVAFIATLTCLNMDKITASCFPETEYDKQLEDEEFALERKWYALKFPKVSQVIDVGSIIADQKRTEERIRNERFQDMKRAMLEALREFEKERK